MRTISGTFFAVSAIAVITQATSAFAFDLTGACGFSQGNWNAPKGAVVSNRSNSPIRSIMDALGESRTHVILSHGTAGWVTHSTGAQPSRQDGCQDNPVTPSELGNAYPGLEQTNLGGIYTFLYGGGTPEFVRYQIPSQANDLGAAEGVVDFAWEWPSNGNEQLWYVQDAAGTYFLGDLWGPNGSFRSYPYSFFQYMFVGNSLTGQASGMGQGRDPGLVCTSALGLMFAKWRAARSPDFSRGNIQPHDYTRDQTINAGGALWSAIYGMCKSGLSWDERKFDWLATCDAGETCYRAAYQVLNCFAFGADINGSCIDHSVDSWLFYLNSIQPGAHSLSADGLLGWSGMPVNNGIWAPYGDSPVQWANAGETYGCWK